MHTNRESVALASSARAERMHSGSQPPAQRQHALASLVDELGRHPGQEIILLQGTRRESVPAAKLYDDVEAARTYLASLGVHAGVRVGVLGANRYEWLVADLALLRLAAVSVAFPVEAFRNTASEELAERYGLQLLITDAIAPSDAAERWVLGFDALCKPAARTGAEALRAPSASAPALDPDVFTLVFSSGTSGYLKCICMSAKGTDAELTVFASAHRFEAQDRMLVALPLSSFQQRAMSYTAIRQGVSVILTDAPQMFHALQLLAPTIIVAPPGVYQLFFTRWNAGRPRWRAALCLALAACFARINVRGVGRRLLRDLRASLGAAPRVLITGSAPCSHAVLRAFELADLPLYEAYGVTEAGLVAWNVPEHRRLGSVGRPVSASAIRLAEDGEVLVRNDPPRTLGYFSASAIDVRATFLPDGTVATGDIGRFDADGFLFLTGRKKDVIVTPNGYKFHPRPIEAAIEEHADVLLAVLFTGDRPGASVVVSSASAADARVRESILERVRAVDRELPTHARIGRILVTDLVFSPDNGLLTRNLKPDRAAISRTFSPHVGASGSQFLPAVDVQVRHVV